MDVLSMPVLTLNLKTFTFPPELEELKTTVPFPPTVFTDEFLTPAQYREMLLEGMPAVLAFIKVHGEIDYNQAVAFVRKPSSSSVNKPRFPLPRTTHK